MVSLVDGKIYGDKTMCAICHDDYDEKSDNDCLRLKCGHIFHYACIEPWIKTKPCPACNTKAIMPLSNKDIAEAGARPVKSIGIGMAHVAKMIVIFLAAGMLVNIIKLGRPFKTPEEIEAETQEIFKVTGQERPLIHSDNWHLWAGGLVLFTLGTGLLTASYKAISGRLCNNVKRINYRPPTIS